MPGQNNHFIDRRIQALSKIKDHDEKAFAMRCEGIKRMNESYLRCRGMYYMDSPVKGLWRHERSFFRGEYS